jgi:polyisoprenoid-binding protein YceI
MKCIAQFFSSIAILFLTSTAFAQKLEPAQSEITFTVKQLGVPVVGRFTKFNGQFTFNPRDTSTSKVVIHIDVGSAKFGTLETDEEIPKDAWFSALRFPQATFESSAIKALGAGKFEALGKLSIKGSMKEMRIPIVLTKSGAVAFAAGSFVVKRLDFKIGEGEWADVSLVANDVEVKFKLALSGIPSF